MRDMDKTKVQLIDELAAGREQGAEARSALRRERVLRRLSQQVVGMTATEDLGGMLRAVRDGLQELDVPFGGCGVNLVDATCDPVDVRLHAMDHEIDWHGLPCDPEGARVIARIWRGKEVAYRRDLEAEDLHGEAEHNRQRQPIRAILDVPFAQGTLAVNSTEPNAFTEQHIEILQDVAQALSEGFQRWADLQALEQRNRELEKRERLLSAFQRVGLIAQQALEVRPMLSELSRQVVEAGMFRSLGASIVDREQNCIEEVCGWASGEDGHVSPTTRDLHRRDLSGSDILARVARSGKQEVIEGWNKEIYSARDDETPQHYTDKVAYFMPIVSGEDVVAVLATASTRSEKEEMLGRIEAMHPLLDQVAVSLEHAQLYHSLQKEIAQRTRSERRREAASRVRDQVWRMKRGSDQEQVLRVVSDALRDAGVNCRDCDINLVDVGGDGPSVRHYDPRRQVWVRLSEDSTSRITELWREGSVAYRRDLEQEDLHGEAGQVERAFGHRPRSLVDVPFADGTLAVNSDQPDAFTEPDIALLQEVAGVLAEGFQRARDLSALRESERRFRLLTETIEDVFWMSTPGVSESIYVSPAYERIWGHSRDVFGTNPRAYVDAIHPDDRQAYLSVVGEHHAAGRPYECEYRIVQPDGRERWIRERGFPGGERSASPEFMAGVCTDITERKRVEEGSRERERDLLRAQHVARMGFLTWNLKTNDVHWSEEVFRLYGIDPAVEPTLDLTMELVHPDDREFAQESLDLAIGGVRPYSIDHRNVRPDGTVIWLHAQGELTRDADGNPDRLLGTVVDITERKQLEQQIVHLERMRVSGELAAGVSHNLNNMLTAVLGPAQLLLRRSDDPEIRHEADAILTAGRRARDLVSRLNQAVRADRADALVPVSINAQVREAVEMARPRWKDELEVRGVSVEVVTQLGETPDIRGIAAELDDVILNLVLNAVQAMPEGGTITITTEAVEAGVRLTVTDTGTGMDRETCRRVFEPFFTTKVSIGTGLGLSTVHGTVTRWGGSIEVNSTPGEGTTFTLCFPAETESAYSEETPGAPVGEARTGKLLIIEDDEEVCHLLDRLLSETHTVTVVRDGREALHQFVPGQYDVALIDLGMPRMAGDRVAAVLKAADSCLATILITGWPLTDADPRKADFDFQLDKPFDDLDEVESVVARAVELHDSRG